MFIEFEWSVPILVFSKSLLFVVCICPEHKTLQDLFVMLEQQAQCMGLVLLQGCLTVRGVGGRSCPQS